MVTLPATCKSGAKIRGVVTVEATHITPRNITTTTITIIGIRYFHLPLAPRRAPT